MKLTRKQFDILETYATNKESLTQRQLEEITGHSLGTVNRVLKELTELGYVEDGRITNSGVNALEPYRAKRVIFIAAGFGTRLVPITFNTPKPLVRVHGVRIIDRLIDACLEAGINEIYIVRGYLAYVYSGVGKRPRIGTRRAGNCGGSTCHCGSYPFHVGIVRERSPVHDYCSAEAVHGIGVGASQIDGLGR